MDTSFHTSFMSKRPTVALFIAFLAVLSVGGQLSHGARPEPSLHVDGPDHVAVGEPIALTLTMMDAVDIAGYEANLLFDTSAAQFSGLQQRDNDLKRLLRDVSPLGTVEMTNGIALGLYSCPTNNCLESDGPRTGSSASGVVHLATVTITPTQPGALEIRLDAVKVVDSAGLPVNVAIGTPTVNIEVGPPGAGPRRSAPAGRWTLPSSVLASPGSPDVTGNGVVSYADAAQVALAWTLAREQGDPCGPAADRTLDMNQDGCIDVADVQLVAAQFSRSAGSISPSSTATFTVDSTADDDDVVKGDGICRTAQGKCTLRAAITEANLRSGADIVAFNIPGAGPRTIRLTRLLPVLSDEMGGITIDGYTQPGAAPNTDPLVSNAVILIEITSSAPLDALQITSSGNVVRGVAIYGVKRSIFLYGMGAHDNQIMGAFIGTDATGTAHASTSVIGWNGIVLAQGAARNSIGGPSNAERNIISGNAFHGVATYDEATDHNIIMNNLIGLAPSGTQKLPNLSHGIDINTFSSYNVIGGLGVGGRNVLSGNTFGVGVEISHGKRTQGNLIAGNFIGTDVTGNIAAPFASNGLGILLEDRVANNVITGNIIGNNLGPGISIEDHAESNQVSYNRIGVSPDGAPLPNRSAGIVLNDHVRRTHIGPGNIIANNPTGIRIVDNASDFNMITRNSIYDNAALGIDLAPTGQVNFNDPNDEDEGANEQLNFPELLSATASEVTGTACGGCIVEVFSADRLAGAHGQGHAFLGSGRASTSGIFTLPVTGIGHGTYVTAIATDDKGNTSEFALNLPVSGLCTNTQTADFIDGTVTLSYTAQTSVPAMWMVWLVEGEKTVLVGSAPLLPTEHAIVSGPITFDYAPGGIIGFLTAIIRADGVVLCGDWDTVDTGEAMGRHSDALPEIRLEFPGQ